MAAHTVTEDSASKRLPAWHALEQPRALFEMWQYMMAKPILRLAPRGVGRPVLVFPGFLTDDEATATLRHYLREQGHAVYAWDLGINLGPTGMILDGIERRLDKIAAAHGEAVNLVGVSLGGLYARDLARRRKGAVRQVITLGSPFRIERDSANSAGALFDALAHLHVDPARFSVWDLPRDPLPVAATAIYTRTDGVVAWEACVDGVSPASENIEVVGSHSGLAHLPAALYAVADRLAQPDGSWRAFAAPPPLQWLYPPPERGANTA